MRAITTGSLLTALLLVGCTATSLPLSSGPSAALGTNGAAPAQQTGATASVPFAQTTATTALTSTTEVTTPTADKALAVNDEAMVESASALMEQGESNLASMYSLASYGGYGGDYGGQGGYGGGDGGFGGSNRDGGGSDGGFSGFGGGRWSVPVMPRLSRQPAPPERGGRFDRQQRSRFSDCYRKDQDDRQNFTQAHPTYTSDEQMIEQVLAAQSWQPNPADPTTVMKSGSETLTLGDKTSRKIAVLRVIDRQAPHELVHGQTDIADVYADGASKTVHWENTLQADGTRDIVFHHEYVTATGAKWVTDWSKTMGPDGSLTGSGTFTQVDASGKVISKETLTIGGADGQGETVTTPATGTASPSPAATATATPAATATASPAATATASPVATATATPAATASPKPSATATADATATATPSATST